MTVNLFGDITFFDGEYRFLSNFHMSPIEFEGIVYPSLENAYQAAKTTPENRQQFVNLTPGKSKYLGRSVALRPDWNDVRIDVMATLIGTKFEPHTELAKRLLRTGDVELIEGNTWGDQFWGMCKGRGENNLGKILMKQREFLLSLENGTSWGQ